eukprot:8589608-Pyramimonas_sp.AAC.1
MARQFRQPMGDQGKTDEAKQQADMAYIERQKREKDSRAIFKDEIDDLLKQENYRAMNVYEIQVRNASAATFAPLHLCTCAMNAYTLAQSVAPS